VDREGSTVELARALYELGQRNALHAAAPGATAELWDGLAYAEQAPWLVLANRGPDRLEHCEGMRFEEVARALFLLARPPEEQEAAGLAYDRMPAEYHLLWESIARMLHAYMDSEDGSAAEAADIFHHWYVRKTAPAENGGREPPVV